MVSDDEVVGPSHMSNVRVDCPKLDGRCEVLTNKRSMQRRMRVCISTVWLPAEGPVPVQNMSETDSLRSGFVTQDKGAAVGIHSYRL